MSKPLNEKLYERITAKVKKRIPKHSAYRSGQIVKEYNVGALVIKRKVIYTDQQKKLIKIHQQPTKN